jgi:hypothetical protein
VQAHLLQVSPSEYVRLIGGLVGPSRAVVLAGGQRMEAAANDLDLAQGWPQVSSKDAQTGEIDIEDDPRSYTERIFQGALQQFGDRQVDPASVYDANTDAEGLWEQQLAHVLGAIYDRAYTVHPRGGKGIDGVRGAEGPARDRLQRAIFEQVRGELDARLGPVPASLVWGAEGELDKHFVMVESIENGRVYFRNPWGSRDAQTTDEPYHDGVQLPDPPRRIEDSLGGLESMDVIDFRKRLSGAVTGPAV